MKTHIIILAAGKGLRMKSSLPKVLHKVGNLSMLEHVIKSTKFLNPSSVNVVVGKNSKLIQDSIINIDLNWVVQDKQIGTADAVKIALPNIPDEDHVLILYGDTPLIDETLISQFLSEGSDSDLRVLTTTTNNPKGYGRVIRDTKKLEYISEIIEELDASEEQKNITECNTGIMYANANFFKTFISQIENQNAKQEFYLTDIVNIANQNNKKVFGFHTHDFEKVSGINDKFQLAQAEKYFQTLQRKKLLSNGATLLDMDSIFIRGEVDIQKDVTFDANVIIEGKVIIGENVQIQSNVKLRNVVIANDTVIKSNTIVEDSEIGTNCRVGPYARIRPNSCLDSDVTVGNFVEVKSSTIGKNSKASHLSYIGDTEIGKEVNVGAGTITCNYDGVNKHKTVIKDNVFIGSDSQLVAPITIEEGVTIAAGSTITEGNYKDSLIIGRARQVVKKDWKRPK